ncbi:SusC/RagA family TonB-linked outer membrane protein [Zobellia uliginosa]|uniref:SusC/RagA family TonB-linked outer membrane protein n=1 Tax=Zobellia uliginosa TaxID=143224 RepID=UPI001C0661C3|nr:TonB-dependent receptor [Zobellia uliginosa]MBU2946198.1 TonB-dependent receptor [Zobellia uliginosa]
MKKEFNELLRKCFVSGLFLILMGIQYSHAQQTITGTIIDENNQPIPGANIVVKGTTNGTQSDFDGNFSITASPNDVLSISYLGYAAETITVGSQSAITISLREDASLLEEVVVIGYGTAKKSDVTGAVAQVTAKSFEDQPLTRVQDALQGRAAGVTVAGSGQPGAPTKVRIRGVNSITGNNDPLVVIDGVFGGDLSTINPNNIQSMEVLKDASALAIYGSRGSNGVILVTTKKGSGKAKVSIDHFVSFSTVEKRLTTLSSAQFAQLENDDFIADPVNDPADVPYSSGQIAAFEANPIKYQDLLFQTGVTNNTQLSISGASDNGLRYFLSGNYIDQTGTQITSKYNRYSFRSNLSKEFNDRFSLAANITASREITKNDQDAFSSGDGSGILRSITWDPTAPVRDANGDYILRSPREVANNNYNPIRRLELSDHELTSDRLNFTLNGKYKFTDNFSYTLIGAVSTVHDNTESYRVEGDFEATGFLNIGYRNFRNTSHQISNILNWNKEFGKNSLDITGVYEFQGARGLTNGYNVSDLNVPTLYLADESNSEDFFNSGNQSAIESYLGRLQYNYDGFVYLTGSMRVDESSRFSDGNRTGYFPSGAIALNFENKSFIQDSGTFSALKLRAGWGKVGNQNINASARFSQNSGTGLYTFDGVTSNTGEIQVQEGNPDLTWETTTQTNVGLDFGFFNNRLSGSIDWFNKDTEDLLLQTIIPGTSIRNFINAGEVNNTGIDLSLSAAIVQTDNFSWDATFALSKLKNEVTSLYDDNEFIVGNAAGIGGGGIRLNVIKVGEPLGTFWGYEYQGTWKTTDNIPVDGDGNPLFQPGDQKFALDENNELEFRTIGSGLPDVTFGFNNTFRYKNWDLNMFWNGSFGFEVYNQVTGTITGNGGNRSNLSPTVYDSWTEANETDIPKRFTANTLNTSRWVEKGDFVRLSNLKLGYTFDDDIIKGVSNLQLYISASNLILITDYSGYDPEVSSQVRTYTGETANADAGAGIDVGAMPNPRTGTLGIKLTF